MTVYSFYVLDAGSTDPAFETRSFDADERALLHAKSLFFTRSKAHVVEVWDGPLRLAHYTRETLKNEPPSL